MGSMEITFEQLRQIVGDVLQLGDRVDSFEADTALLGSVPEFDSMAVVAVITTLEDQYGIMIDDDEISADVFATMGDLHEFLNQKLASAV